MRGEGRGEGAVAGEGPYDLQTAQVGVVVRRLVERSGSAVVSLDDFVLVARARCMRPSPKKGIGSLRGSPF